MRVVEQSTVDPKVNIAKCLDLQWEMRSDANTIARLIYAIASVLGECILQSFEKAYPRSRFKGTAYYYGAKIAWNGFRFCHSERLRLRRCENTRGLAPEKQLGVLLEVRDVELKREIWLGNASSGIQLALSLKDEHDNVPEEWCNLVKYLKGSRC